VCVCLTPRPKYISCWAGARLNNISNLAAPLAGNCGRDRCLCVCDKSQKHSRCFFSLFWFYNNKLIILFWVSIWNFYSRYFSVSTISYRIIASLRITFYDEVLLIGKQHFVGVVCFVCMCMRVLCSRIYMHVQLFLLLRLLIMFKILNRYICFFFFSPFACFYANISQY